MNSKKKGSRGERALRDVWRSHGYDEAHRSGQFSAKGESAADLEGSDPKLHEIWKPVKGYENLYEVSSLGRVASLPKYNYKTRRIMKQHISKRDGRCSVILCRNPSDHKRSYVHRMVAEAFIDNTSGFVEVNHKDENPQNNRADNLEWCDRLYNMNYGKMNELHLRCKRPIKATNENHVLFFDGIVDAEKEGFSRSTIKKALKTGKLSVGYVWEYDDASK